MYARFRTALRFSEGDLWRFVHPFKSTDDQVKPEIRRKVLRILFEQVFEPALTDTNHG
jgi:hypothetical protein